ncbi:hypothetical protein CDL12_12080 [Handroanthus impetiginosus]|uniref:Uncharacterized protein n=1 Tax=Handroanthus impetiginosus TaxID=429701 RepID=A0A2G9HCN8_9LAMI|nr:hypothetical protein CDL12_12080 [Handroanthus impetiginosus]
MDLGCIDMGCVEKPKKEASFEKENSPKESVMSGSKIGKNGKAKDAVRSSLSALNKLTSQISKPTHRKTSPLNWFPRKKVEPYLKRKIKMLQEVDGMHLTLDETLGDSNPHYSRVLREKIAIREAAEKAMEARKAAMVEASWCRILQAARIESKEAEAQLSKAEAFAAEAFEAARAAGVIMNDIPDSSQNHYKIEMTSAKGGSTTHTVSATFETAFEVDKQVASAVKAAFIKLANCPSISKDEFKELLCKISENPDTDETYNELSTSECEADAGSEMEGGLDKDSLNCPGEIKKRQESDKFSMGNIVDMMLGRLRCLKEDELASLATIVATSGLNAALPKMVNSKQHTVSSANPCPKVPRTTSLGGRNARNSIIHAQIRGTADSELPSLDKFLVKRLTRLEREVLEAKNARKNDVSERKIDVSDDVKIKEGTSIPDLGSVLVKHSSKLEKEVEEARMNCKSSEIGNKKVETSLNQEVTEVPSLDKFLVKRLTKLEREVQEARNRKATDSEEILVSSNGDSSKDKENMDLNKIENITNLLQREKKEEASARSKDGTDYESLDKVLVKHVSRLEKEKLEFRANEQMVRKSKRKDNHREYESSECSLDQVLVKHKSRLEREKIAAAAEERDDSTRYSVSRRQAREKELQEAWGGLSLGNSIRPHVSRLQRDKAAWLKAEEEERKRAAEGEV